MISTIWETVATIYCRLQSVAKINFILRKFKIYQNPMQNFQYPISIRALSQGLIRKNFINYQNTRVITSLVARH